MTGRRRRRRGRAVLVTGLALGGLVTGVPPASAASGPGPLGRSTYVISMIDGKPGSIAARLATYSFAADGTVTERYWAWRQDGITGKGNARWTKPASGLTTAGCLRACPVRTPVGFQRGTSPRSWRGRWQLGPGNVLTINWSPTYAPERWQLDDGQPGIVGARLISGREGAQGWGVGSNAAPDRGVSLAAIHGTGTWVTGPFVVNAYTATTQRMAIGWSASDYSACASGTCLQGTRLSGPDRRSWYHSYFAANPLRDGRKVFWNNQTGVVQQLESPTTVCISSSGGGHTNALLQALDDTGHFVGFVGVEASLNARKPGQDIVGAYTMLQPQLLSAIGQS